MAKWKFHQPLKFGAELNHHGIKNMHWGVRNGPPYPLDRKVSARIRKGDNEKARISDKEYKDMRSGKKKTNKKDWAGITHLGGSRVQARNEMKFKEVISASDLPKMMNVAEAIGSGGKPDNFRRLDRPGGKIRFVDAQDVNMRRNMFGDRNGHDDPGLNNNCGKCSAALFLRSKGFDVQAGRTALGTLTSAPQYWFDGATPYKEKSVENIERRMAAFGNKGQGIFSCRRADGSGHALYFQNEKQENGQYKPVIYDGQIGKRYTDIKQVFDAENFDSSQFSTITRLDNATPNWKHLDEDNVIRMNYSNRGMNKVLNTTTGQYWDADSFKYN